MHTKKHALGQHRRHGVSTETSNLCTLEGRMWRNGLERKTCGSSVCCTVEVEGRQGV